MAATLKHTRSRTGQGMSSPPTASGAASTPPYKLLYGAGSLRSSKIAASAYKWYSLAGQVLSRSYSRAAVHYNFLDVARDGMRVPMNPTPVADAISSSMVSRVQTTRGPMTEVSPAGGTYSSLARSKVEFGP